MAITKLSNSGIATGGVLKYDSMLAGNAAYNPSNYNSISSTIVTSASSSSITLSSIPSTYKHLILRVIAKNTASGETFWNNLKIYLNNDTNENNYFGFRAMADGTSASSASQGATAISGSYNGGGQGSNLFSANIFEFLDYTDTNKYRSSRCFHGSGYAGGTYSVTGFTTSTWKNTAAISTMTLEVGSGNFAVGSTVSLYGLETV